MLTVVAKEAVFIHVINHPVCHLAQVEERPLVVVHQLLPLVVLQHVHYATEVTKVWRSYLQSDKLFGLVGV